MSILSVGPASTYPSIAAAMLDAVAGDTVALESGYSNEVVTIALNNITVDGDATSTGIILQLGSGIATFTLIGGAPFSVLDGPDGNGIVGNDGDNVLTVSSGVDAINGGAGVDRLIVDYQLATGSVTGNSTSNFTEAGGGGRSVTVTNGTIENFTVLTGGQADTITTGDGNDLINVSNGANTVTAGGGNNTVVGGAGADIITTGDGNDQIDAGAGANTVVAGQGANTVLGGNDADVITAGDGGNFVDGGDGTNTITTGSGDDSVLSGNGADTIIVNAGDDVVTVTGGADTVDSGADEDNLVVDYSASTTGIVSSALTGNFFVGYSGSFTAAASDVVDFVGVENFQMIGGTGADTITTGDGEDQFDGGGSNDILKGNGGNDAFTGGSGNDILDGGDDFDTAYYSGQRGDYLITQIGPGAVSVQDLRDGSPDGIDMLYNVELRLFANSSPIGTVTIIGDAAEDQVLTASNNLIDADGLGDIGYQWLANGTAIAGATNTSFTLTQGQVGKTITVIASYTDGQGRAESATSAATAAVANVNDAPTGTVIISGVPTEDQVLTATNTLADEDGLDADALSYQWFADGTAIDGATTDELTLTQDEVGKAITVTASYTDGQDFPEAVTSEPTALVSNVNDEPSGEVVITGTAAEDQVLTATNTLTDEDGLDADTLSYQWFANGTAIDGATTDELTLTQDEVGKAITVTASYTDGQDFPEAVTSEPTALVSNVNDEPSGEVVITGTAAEDQVLTATNTLTDEDGLGTITYQWLAAGSAIAGATGNTFTLTQAQVGRDITVVAGYVDDEGTNEEVTAAPTSLVANINDAPVGDVTINGTPTEDEVLTVSNTLTDEDGLGTIVYQWQADGSSIAGATGTAYTVTQDEVGKTITVIASYVDMQGTNEAVASAATGAVAAGLPSFYFTTTDTGVSGQVKAVVYNGPVTYLNYEFAGTNSDEAVVGTAANDFLHLAADDDAVDGGEGRDVIDGGTGSNFLSGGSGSDVFFLDGRNGETTWSTITDWQRGEQLSVWGWRDGVSQATFVEDAGTTGYRGVTMHADLNGNGVIDTSVTWTGLTQASLPGATIHEGLLWFA